jgi:hypothetical protein
MLSAYNMLSDNMMLSADNTISDRILSTFNSLYAQSAYLAFLRADSFIPDNMT